MSDATPLGSVHVCTDTLGAARIYAPTKHGDPNWLAAHRELEALHREKSATYGTTTDPLANFTDVAHLTGHVPERYALERLVEKASRALHMINAGNGWGVKEYPDMASLALCCEALRRRRA